MSEYKQKPGSGIMFVNDKKESEQHPDFRGDITLLNGEKKQIAAWKKKGSNGKTFLSLKISEPYNGSSKTSPSN